MSLQLEKKTSSKNSLEKLYLDVRKTTEELCKPLEIEDYTIQTIEDVSPPKWHLGHTSWFFENLILKQYSNKFQYYNDSYNFIFNSYYESLGERIERSKRGIVSRPTVKEVYLYRKNIDDKILDLINKADDKLFLKIKDLIILGLHHEMQHQELLITDIKNIFTANLIVPVYCKPPDSYKRNTMAPEQRFISYGGGIFEIGFNQDGFAFDNEKPVHKVYVNPFKIQNRLVINKEYLDFINDGGYSKSQLWLSDGWDAVQNNKWNSPLYWEKIDNEWFIKTLNGLQKINLNEPVCHVSFYEADAFARWSKKRLLTEFEWETAAYDLDIRSGNFLENKIFHPVQPADNPGIDSVTQMFGDVWEWTNSCYLPYPGYKPLEGALSEYNGKFMSNQMVLRGGSCATPKMHIRKTYRNFFQCDKRWQFTGIRLGEDV